MSYPDRYTFLAFFEYEDNQVGVRFPDLSGCITVADQEAEAVDMAKEALALHLYGMEQDGDDIPSPSSPKDTAPEDNEYAVYIDVWMPPFRSDMQQRSIKKTLTLPAWLDDIAKEHKINYSQLLQDALKEHIGVHKPLISSKGQEDSISSYKSKL
ncbi:type II toxin-antitoxin system HicB family antitoxin [Salibacterium halotolerans]|uniref:Predicted nuclease of the RNAse H fold, HicB family n=1 Tax=Salibacterium halotolerans TaxID=1884432 RepID=A0A1I5MQV4_9BACI|nr:type II toxin-antitoxin system HicB family antitoxin [Salibacterium halotolerans]SFP11984.1 Predicted nuclease of the RNAse H fold, HicB family [Salibacterium halotolerans]